MADILIVEDDPAQLRLYAKALRGYRLTCAASGTTALEQIRRHIPDVIILDHVLADGELGADFLPRLKDAAAHVPVLLISGWNMPCAPTRTPREILKLGADALGVPLTITAVPLWLLPLVGPFSRFMKEVVDVGFTFDRPYVIDASKFTSRFSSDVTPFEVGAPATARSFVAAAVQA